MSNFLLLDNSSDYPYKQIKFQQKTNKNQNWCTQLLSRPKWVCSTFDLSLLSVPGARTVHYEDRVPRDLVSFNLKFDLYFEGNGMQKIMKERKGPVTL